MKNKLNCILKTVIGLFSMVLALGMNDLAYVNAEITAPSSLNFHYKDYDPLLNYHTIYRNHYIVGSNKYVYCMDYALDPPTSDLVAKLNGEITDAGLVYILKSGYGNSTIEEAFVTQASVWLYLHNKGQMTKTGEYASRYEVVKKLYDVVYNTDRDNAYSVKIRNLLEKANKASAEVSTISLDVSSSSLSFSLNSDKTAYVSSVITVSTNSDASYTVTLENAPSSATVKKTDDGKGFIVTVPASSIVAGTTTNIKVKVAATRSYYKAYKYVVSDKYQPVAHVLKDTISKSTTVSGNITVKISTFDVKIRKVDAVSNERIEGAKLCVVAKADANDSSKYTNCYTSSATTDIVVKGLVAGEYVIVETVTPDGYLEATENVSFTIDENGNVTYGNSKSAEDVILVLNTPIPEEVVDVPNTGSFKSSLPYCLGGMMMMIGIVVVGKSSKKQTI